ncbi:MAG: family 10 glycosylhydrolase [Candidatus Omnitrophica bacterium]|nr:family 10 glycosylhydrolase [Candidatus Omnitrophota bacterium]
MKTRVIALLFFISFIANAAFCQEEGGVRKGVWVTVFSEQGVLYSREAVLKLVNSCKRAGINEIYLQVYQSGKAYYDSKIGGRSKYEAMLKSAGADPIDLLLKEAGKNNIKVFAWVNLLSLGQNAKADIVNEFGGDIFTRDQYLRLSGRASPNESDKYYLREDQLFLEPGDQRVARYLISIIEEIIARYPLLSGIHLDYVRYPMTVPFIPGARFTKYGLSYGYGRENLERFKEWTGLDPLKGLKGGKNCAKWDDWRRKQLTSLVRRITKRLKEKSKSFLVSAAVVPSGERAYTSMFQDWPYWLEEGILDYVVLMNYTQDKQLTKEIVRASLGYRQKGKVLVGMGLYLMKDNPEVFFELYKMVKNLSADGIVIFSYDDMTEEILEYLSKSQ